MLLPGDKIHVREGATASGTGGKPSALVSYAFPTRCPVLISHVGGMCYWPMPGTDVGDSESSTFATGCPVLRCAMLVPDQPQFTALPAEGRINFAACW
eukprot:787356-Rhodomonas_salina.3